MDSPEVREALKLIDNLRLPHLDSRLLSSYINEALDPDLAASYVTENLRVGDAHSLLANWTYIVEAISVNGLPPPLIKPSVISDITKRDGRKCCITGKPGTLWDHLEVVPILPIPTGWATDNPDVGDMLEAFFGPQYLDWWYTFIERHILITKGHKNHWLVRRSAAKAFSRGLVCLNRRQSMVEFQVVIPPSPEDPIRMDGTYALLGDHSRTGIVTIDARFIGTHARLSTSIRLLAISRELSKGPSLSGIPLRRQPLLQPLNRAWQAFGGLLITLFFGIWRHFPEKARIAVYKMLRPFGQRLYGSPDSQATVQRLPFGLYLKYNGKPHVFRNEFNAMRMLQNAPFPVPRSLDIATEEPNSNGSYSFPKAYLVTTRVPGVPLWRCQDVTTDADCETIALQLAGILTFLRGIPKTVNPSMAICNTLGEACADPRIKGGSLVGPFLDEAAFSQELRFSDEASRRGHKILFTHADLNPRNILVDRIVRADGSRGRTVSGIVDWETAGYYPEYWDCTKAFFEGFRWSKRYNDLVLRAFKER